MEPIINRRLFFKAAATGMVGCFLSPEVFSQNITTAGAAPATILNTAKYVVFVLLYGAPSQIDTFDLKVGTWTPADFAPNTINGIVWPGGLMPIADLEPAPAAPCPASDARATARLRPG